VKVDPLKSEAEGEREKKKKNESKAGYSTEILKKFIFSNDI
jgi:hypothetical protein